MNHLFSKIKRALTRDVPDSSQAHSAPEDEVGIRNRSYSMPTSAFSSESCKDGTLSPSRAATVPVPTLLSEPSLRVPPKPKKRDSSAACPPHAVKSVVGQRVTMEDTWAAVPDLLSLSSEWSPPSTSTDHLPTVPPPSRGNGTRHLANAAAAAAVAVGGGPSSPAAIAAGSPAAASAEDAPLGRPSSSPRKDGLASRSVGRSTLAPIMQSTAAVSEPLVKLPAGSIASPPGSAGLPTPASELTSSSSMLPPLSPLGTPAQRNSGSHKRSGSALEGGGGSSAQEGPPPAPFNAHFFAVYDGHGGAEVAKHCAKKLHETLRDIVQRRNVAASAAAAAAPAAAAAATAAAAAALADAACWASGGGACSPAAPAAPLEVILEASGTQLALEPALVQAFLETDEELLKAHTANEVGSTAVASLLGPRHIWVANCGDSRAVLCRHGEALCLSVDHKATRGDEVARIEAAGGYIWWDRVMGELAISRAIGDHGLRPYVIAHPEVTRVLRRSTDQVMILASDGLWDVLSSQEVCSLALEKFTAEMARGGSSKSAVKRAASSLVKAALQRGTRDNVTVMVVDVRYEAPPGVPLSPRAVGAAVGPTGSTRASYGGHPAAAAGPTAAPAAATLGGPSAGVASAAAGHVPLPGAG